ncbi:hypothetical protein NRIC_36270 [Enterococcus florum]|uniref:Uncharacterized protein n=1 Tax=Enterococcus florum TaxID=2480627 RepID=A0A4P5PCY8_9ENTE|nr:hypothetical protein [Enterococcus florum]GCF95736.1 hypothetical protein NRIC_36270 [Enterococcus florum]
MHSLQKSLIAFKINKSRFLLNYIYILISMFLLTSWGLLYLLLSQLVEQTNVSDVQLFTSKEVGEIQNYYLDHLGICCLLIGIVGFVLYFIFQRQHAPKPFGESTAAFIIHLFCTIGLSILTLLVLFVFFEPLYERLLQNVYQYSLDQFENVPNFVLSNGNSGFAYSLRWPFSLNFSSATMLSLFLNALARAGSFLFAILLVFNLIILFLLKQFKR